VRPPLLNMHLSSKRERRDAYKTPPSCTPARPTVPPPQAGRRAPLAPPPVNDPFTHPSGLWSTPTPRLYLVQAQPAACRPAISRASPGCAPQRSPPPCATACPGRCYICPVSGLNSSRGELLNLPHLLPGRERCRNLRDSGKPAASPWPRATLQHF
jgi:hypothetical protein